MDLQKGWLKRQMAFASSTTQNWPDWMKQEAGIHQPAKDQQTHQEQQTNQTQTFAPQAKEQELIAS